MKPFRFYSVSSRFADNTQMPKYSGIAPIIQRSGKRIHVNFRWACPKFIRQSFHEFAGKSIIFCGWARAYYDCALARGKDHNAAIRALAFKWQRIIWRCWQDRTPYDDAKYTQNLKKRGIKMYQNLSVEPVKNNVN